MLKGFMDFISKGNVLDLAVGVIIGGAFGAIVNSLVADVLMPIVGQIFGSPDFSALKLGPILIGNFLNAIIAFLMIAAAVYYFIVTPVNAMKKKEAAAPAAPAEDVVLLREIRDALKK